MLSRLHLHNAKWLVSKESVVSLKTLFHTTNFSPRLECAKEASRNQPFYSYLKHVYETFSQNENHSNSFAQKHWPPSLLEALGGKTKEAWKNLEHINSFIEKLNQKHKDLKDVENLLSETTDEISQEESKELESIAEQEKRGLLKEIVDCDESIQDNFLDALEQNDSIDCVILEITPGVGGQEAMLFTGDLFRMYELLCSNYGQIFEIEDVDKADFGGMHKATASISFTNKTFFQLIQHESGTHRVQRVPLTEKSGRIHTSTASVAILPTFDPDSVILDKKDIEIKPVKKSNSAGGQHANKTESGIRIKHLPTGKIVECNSSRSQDENRARALKILAAKLSAEKRYTRLTELAKVRQQQVKNRERSDKIRTYNFHQGRVTEHRTGVTIHTINAIMDGQEPLMKLMEGLEQKHRLEGLDLIIKTLLNEGTKFYKRKFD